MANLNTAISPAPAITCYTKGGQVASSYTGTVTVALGSNPTGATLGGTLAVAAVAGVATFSDLTLNRSGKSFTLTGTATGLRAATSTAFSIPTHLVFTTQPASTTAGVTMANVVVTVRDGAGNTDTAYTGNVTVALYSATAAGVLSGTLTVAAVAGVATFSTLSISLSGVYTLIASAAEIATCYPPASIVSSTFGIGDYVLTAVDLGSDTFGKNSGGSGSISPTTYLGSTIRDLKTQFVDVPDPGLDYTTIFILNGSFSQNAFTSLTINNQTLLTVDATFTVANTWTWETATSPLTAAGTYAVTFV